MVPPMKRPRVRRRALFGLLCMSLCLGIVTLSSPTFNAAWLVVIPSTSKDSQPAPSALHQYRYPDANQSKTLNEDNDPFFVFHVGPPKTATTSLQYALTNYHQEGILERDGYFYVGQYMDDSADDMVTQHQHGALLRQLREKNCIQAINRARVEGHALWPPCYRRLEKMLTTLRQQNQSIIMSEELFSVLYVELLPNHVDTWDWTALNNLLRSTGWQPLVLVAYRRLAEILPSAHQQWERWDKRVPALVEWPGQGIGRPPRPLGPVLLTDPRLGDAYHPSVPDLTSNTMLWSYTDHLIDTLTPHIPIRVFTIHTKNDANSSFLSHFFCDVLPYASHACEFASNEKYKTEKPWSGSGKLDDARDNSNGSPMNITVKDHQNPQASLFYDALVCEASLRGWISRLQKARITRREAAMLVEHYWEVQMQRGGPYTLSLSCPNRYHLDRLLNASLAKEEKIWGHERAKSWKDSHVQAFESAVTLHKFCDIDLNATLAAAHWRRFFRFLGG